ncbi:MAG: thioredoxin domain-containing protein [Myxococcales bacterium]
MSNRLASSASAYLRQHAHNPVDWYPWGPEAHDLARRLDRPILLSIGYSACHWCHVMAHESFEDPRLAQVLNEGFVSIKVDREERPDVDHLYQGVVQLMGRGGGWPLTVFLTPDLKPFFGGTYFPKDDRYGMPSFGKLLAATLDAWKNRREQVVDSSAEFQEGLRALMGSGLGGAPGELSAKDLVLTGERVAQELDPKHGGFGLEGPKFPNPSVLDLVLRAWRRSGARDARDQVLFSLDQMSGRGLFDHLGGGFHRYCVDGAWKVPHFEKMLYDNGQLLRLYSEAHQIRPDPGYRRTVELTVEWLEREMTSPQGGFYSSQDADSDGEEGKFFVWTPKEIEAAVGDPQLAALLCRRFGVDERGNFEHGRTVLSLAAPVDPSGQRTTSEDAEAVERGRRLLFQAREKRIHPGRDEKIVAGWNGLVIGGLAKASRVFARPDWARLAERAASFVLGSMTQDGRLARVWAEGRTHADGQLEDYGDLAEGLVQLYMASFDVRWLEAARDLADRALSLFWDERVQAFLAAPKDGEQLVVPVWAVHDNAWPSGASTLAEALVALSALTGDASRTELVETYLSKLREPMLSNPFAFGRLWCAADLLLDGAPSLAVAGAPESARPLLDAVEGRYAPTLAVATTTEQPPAILAKAFEGKGPSNGSALAYLCRSFTCELPARTPEEVLARIGSLAAAPAP